MNTARSRSSSCDVPQWSKVSKKVVEKMAISFFLSHLF
eukprot:UN00789